MVRYVKCPRCDLNYIDGDKQEYCDVCLKEMKGIRTDADEIEEEEAAELPTELCPVCGENMMRAGEKMCEECRKKLEFEPDPNDDAENDEWREYLDDDADLADDGDLGESFGEDFDEDIDEEDEDDDVFGDEDDAFDDEDDDLEYVTGDEIYSLSDDDEDDDGKDEDDF